MKFARFSRIFCLKDVSIIYAGLNNRKTPFLLFFAGYGYRYFVQCLQGLSPLLRFAAVSDFLPRKPQPVSDYSIRFSMNRPIQGAESGVLRLGPATITRR